MIRSFKLYFLTLSVLFIFNCGIKSQERTTGTQEKYFIRYPVTCGYVLSKTLSGFMLCDNLGKLRNLNNIVYDGSILFDYGSWNSTGLPLVFGVYEFSYKTIGGNKLSVNDKELTNAFPFSNGFAIVQKGSKYNFINNSGKIISDIYFDYVENFSCGLAVVGKGKFANSNFKGSFGYIDTTGHIVIPMMFENAESFKNDEARVNIKGKNLFIDKAGMPVQGGSAFEAGLNKFVSGTRSYQRPEEIDAIKYPYKSEADEMLTPLIVSDKWGFSNKNGQIVIQPQYELATKFDEGIASVKKNNKWSFITGNGNLINNEWFDEVSNFNRGTAIVKVDGKAGIIGRNGKYIVNLIYPVFDISGGNACITKTSKQGKSFTYINREGVQILPWVEMADKFVKGRAVIKRDDGMFATIDTSGNIVENWHYRIVYTGDLLKILEANDLYTFQDKAGRLSGQWLPVVDMFPEGYLAIRKDSMWGFIDKNGRTQIPFKYNECWNFKDGIALVRISSLLYLINKNGQMITNGYNRIGTFSQNYAPVMKKRKWGYINRSGSEVIKPQFDAASDFREGCALVKKGGKFGYIDQKGKKLTGFEFTAGGDFNNGIAIVKKGKVSGYVDHSGSFTAK